jgi:hypothetical protein
MTDRILLLIKRLLLGACDVTMVETCHRALFILDRSILGAQMSGLAPCQLAFTNLSIIR